MFFLSIDYVGYQIDFTNVCIIKLVYCHLKKLKTVPTSLTVFTSAKENKCTMNNLAFVYKKWFYIVFELFWASEWVGWVNLWVEWSVTVAHIIDSSDKTALVTLRELTLRCGATSAVVCLAMPINFDITQLW